MAASTYTILFTWENEVSFKMQTKAGEGNWFTVVNAEENTHMKAITGLLSDICQAATAAQLDIIMKEMEA